MLFGARFEPGGEVDRDLFADGLAVEGLGVGLVDVNSEGDVIGGSGGVAVDVLLKEVEQFGAAAGPVCGGADGSAVGEGEGIEEGVGLNGGFIGVITRWHLGDGVGREECGGEQQSGVSAMSHGRNCRTVVGGLTTGAPFFGPRGYPPWGYPLG